MAVKTKFKPTKFANVFDTNKPEYSTLDEMGVQVVVEKNTFSVLAPSGANIVGQIGLKEGVVGIAMAGGLPDIAKVPVAAAIKASFKHALKIENWSPQVSVEDVTDETLTVDDVYGDEPDCMAAEEAAEGSYFKDIDLEVKVEPTKFVDGLAADAADDEAILKAYAEKVLAQHKAKKVQNGHNLPKVALIDAEALYQPVKSTSVESTYYCVAMSGDLKFAARRQHDALSIRVEGPVQKNKSVLIAAGFNEEYIKKGYTSVHFHGIDDLMAQRALGAVLFGTGLVFDTQMPDVTALGGD